MMSTRRLVRLVDIMYNTIITNDIIQININFLSEEIMIKHGTAPYLECSSKGDVRFSAFYARIKGRSNKSIEELYQAFKVFEDGKTGLNWREAKGKRAVNSKEAAQFYKQLWGEYIEENPALLKLLINATGLSDRFGQKNHCCQATELWEIRNNKMGEC